MATNRFVEVTDEENLFFFFFQIITYHLLYQSKNISGNNKLLLIITYILLFNVVPYLTTGITKPQNSETPKRNTKTPCMTPPYIEY